MSIISTIFEIALSAIFSIWILNNMCSLLFDIDIIAFLHTYIVTYLKRNNDANKDA